jgi:hypothetical protein
MRTLNFSSVLNGVAQLAGLDRDNLSTAEFRRIRDLADGRLAICWEGEYWPDVSRVVSAVVTDTDGVEVAPFPSDAGEILNVLNKNPRKTTAATLLAWTIYDDGTDRYIQLRDDATPIWLEYRIVRPNLTGDVWSSTSTYASGDQVYFSGNLYDANAATSAAESPTTTASKWDLVKIPKGFQNYLIRGAFADYLRAIGDNELASMADINAESILMMEADKLYRQQGQVRRLDVATY